MKGDWVEIWQERGPLEDLFPVACTDQLAVLLDAWPWGCGHFHIYLIAEDRTMRRIASIIHFGNGKWMSGPEREDR